MSAKLTWSQWVKNRRYNQKSTTQLYKSFMGHTISNAIKLQCNATISWSQVKKNFESYTRKWNQWDSVTCHNITTPTCQSTAVIFPAIHLCVTPGSWHRLSVMAAAIWNTVGLADSNTVYRPTAKICQLSWETQFDPFLKPNTLRGASTVPDGPWQVAMRLLGDLVVCSDLCKPGWWQVLISH